MTQLAQIQKRSIIPSLWWSDDHQYHQRKGRGKNAVLVYHRKSLLQTAQPGRHPEKPRPGCLQWAFSFWRSVHSLIDKSEGVHLRDIVDDGRKPSRPKGFIGLLHKRRTSFPDLQQRPAGSFGANEEVR